MQSFKKIHAWAQMKVPLLLNVKVLFADFQKTKFWFPELLSSYAWHVTV